MKNSETKTNKKNLKATKKPKIVLLDSHAILHRAYHALPNFSSSKGEPTGALYGLATMIMSIVKDLKPDYILATFDVPKPTYRHESYTDYKAGRKETDKELILQIKRAYDFFKAFNIPVFEKEGYEADDVLGTLSENLKKDADVIIASGDMDTLQLVDGDSVKVYTLKKGIKDTIIYNESAVFSRFGFGPKLLPDYKGLRGDPSDNIIGVAGIGEKTATTLITSFGSIEDIYKVLEKKPENFKTAGISDRIVKLLQDNKEEAEFSKMLATIRRDVPVKFEIPKETWAQNVPIQSIEKLFKELEFKSLVFRLNEVFAKDAGTNKELENNSESKKDTKKDVVSDNTADSKNDDLTKIDPQKFKEAQIAVWLLNSSITNPDMSDIFAESGIAFDMYNLANDKSSFDLAYAKLFEKIKQNDLERVYDLIEKPLVKIVDDMEKAGVKIDKKFLKSLSEEYHVELKKLEKNIWGMAGVEFNINSPQQLSDVLFNKMQLTYKGMRKTSTGKLSTREDVLQKMRGTHEIIDQILEYREFQKLLSTYIDNIPGLVSEDGRLRANFMQTGTTTGRMSSNNPNLQNIPIGTERGRKIRHAFVADKGNVLVAFDYSQIELRIAAILSGDEKMIDAFKKGEDIHTNVACHIFNLPPEKIDKEKRRQAKVINFGILYGMGVNSLREGLGSDRKTAQEFYNQYFKVYDGLSKYLEQTKKNAVKNGYTETMFGRRRYFDGFNSPLPYIRAQAERMAINAPIQGTQADLTKRSMVLIDEYLHEQKIADQFRLILQIHDEVIYEAKEDLVQKHAEKIKKIMASVLDERQTAGVPIVAECAVGMDWGNMKSI